MIPDRTNPQPSLQSMREQQRGSTLIVALIMLVMLTLIAVSAINSTNSGTQMVANAQYREEAGAAAQRAIESVISTDFTAAPTASVVPVDINGDSVNDYTVNVAKPVCTSSIKDPALCIGSGQATGGATESASGIVPTKLMLECFKQTWEISATAVDNHTGAQVKVHQGVFTRVGTGTGCPDI